MKSSIRQDIFLLTLKLEIYVNIIGVPLAIYFEIIMGNLSGADIWYFLLGAVISTIIMALSGTMLRFRKLGKIIDALNILNPDYKSIKIKLLTYPSFEAKLIAMRWIIGILLTYLLFNLLTTPNFIQSLPFLIAPFLIIPINMVINFFLQKIFSANTIK